ncbi:MAG: alpha/beta hydrolase [Microbacteriaceae bacterium]|nr:alpha/beta hydrolase [Microbacteriaceae bacterium]
MLSFRHSGDLGKKIAMWIPSLGQQSRMWAEMPSVLDDWSNVFVELPGHGDNSPADRSFSITDLADECLEYLKNNARDAERVVVIGLSIGGTIALEIARSLSGDSAVVVMAAAATMGDAAIWQSRAELARTSGTTVMKEAAQSRWFTDEFVESNSGDVNKALDSLGSVDGESYALCAEALGGFDGTQTARHISVPVLVIAAERDEVVPLDQARDLSELVPRGEFVEIPQARHLFPIENPGEVAQLISTFIDRVRGASNP